MPKVNVSPSATSVLDVIYLNNTAGAPFTGLGQLSAPTAPTLTLQTSGGTLTASVDIKITYTTTPGSNGASTGETLPTSNQTVTISSGTTNSVLVTLPSFPPTAQAANIYMGNSGGTLYQVTGTGFPVPYGTGAIVVGTVPSSSNPQPPIANTSWPNGLTASMTVDNASSSTSLPIYIGTAGTWSNAAAPNLTFFEMGGGLYQVSYPNAAFNVSNSKSVTFSIYGVLGLAATQWSILIANFAVGAGGGYS